MKNIVPSIPKPEYRKDIEGLRAVSILLVVLYHAGLASVTGGFIGVDVFFVISGFLIGRLLLVEYFNTGTIRVFEFWARRIRRLIPNAVMLLVFVSIAAIFLSPGYSREQLSSEIVSAALYYSNYLFSSKSVDYFHSDDPESPVQHFWSLSVEEQFYIALPILIIIISFIFKRNINLFEKLFPVIIGVLCIVSLGLSLFYLKINQPKAFFHTEARIWQLGIGILLAFVWLRGWRPNAIMSHILSTCGLLAIFVIAFLFDNNMAYPGWYGLLPVAAAAAIIAGGMGHHRTPTLWLLERRFMQWIGVRSYAWYLWHWPLLLYAHHYWKGHLVGTILMLLLSITIAHLTYTLVENPIRKGKMRLFVRTGATFTTGFTFLAVASLTAFLPSSFHPLMVDKNMLRLVKEASQDLNDNYRDGCHLNAKAIESPPCIYGNPGASRAIYLFGDSHAAQWLGALQKVAGEKGWRLHAWTKTSCPAPMVQIYNPFRRANYVTCSKWRENIIRRIIEAKDRKKIVFIAFNNHYIGWIRGRDGRIIRERDKTNKALQDGLKRLLERFITNDINVIVLRDTPRMYRSYRDCLVERGGKICDRPRKTALISPPLEEPVVREMAETGKVIFLDLTNHMCDEKSCKLLLNNKVIYRDHHHITKSFSQYLAPAFSGVIREE